MAEQTALVGEAWTYSGKQVLLSASDIVDIKPVLLPLGTLYISRRVCLYIIGFKYHNCHQRKGAKIK